MEHRFMEALAARLVARGLAVLRYNFPYAERGRKRPDAAPKLRKTVRSAHAFARDVADGLPLFEGGKSMGGRITSLEAAEGSLEGTRGLIFFGFPLHSPSKPGTERAAHLDRVPMPMLFLQGTRDNLARLDLLRPVLDPLAGATLCIVDGADHGFHVLKRSGRTDDEVLDELADETARWCRAELAAAGPA